MTLSLSVARLPFFLWCRSCVFHACNMPNFRRLLQCFLYRRPRRRPYFVFLVHVSNATVSFSEELVFGGACSRRSSFRRRVCVLQCVCLSEEFLGALGSFFWWGWERLVHNLRDLGMSISKRSFISLSLPILSFPPYPTLLLFHLLIGGAASMLQYI